MNRLDTDWLTADQAAIEFELPLEQVLRLYREVVAGKHGKQGVAYYIGADRPMITVRTLKELMGKLPPPTKRHRNSRR